MKLDLKNFHKIECDGKCTTLQHPNGHQIKVAHKGLSKEHREELDALPTKMAKGGYAKFAQKFDPSIKGSKASGASEVKPMKDYPEYKMPRSEGYTEPDDIGTDDIVLKALHHEAPPFGAERAEKPHYPPCINPSCKSYGRSHPNCRCYGGNPEVGNKQGMFAKGGEVDTFCSQDRKHQKGCAYYAEGTPNAPVEQADEDQQQPVTAAPVSTNQQASQNAEQPDQNQSSVASATAPQLNMNPEGSAQAPQQPQDPVTQKAGAIHQVMNDELAQTSADKKDGVIHPETYNNLLWKDKSTLGKIGTLFGLMVGGAGAGLSGQKSAILEMMDNTIKRDTDAQQNSVQNENNILKINQENLANNANVSLTKQQAGALGLVLTNNQKKMQALDHLSTTINNMPDTDPRKAAMQSQLVYMQHMVGNDILSGNALASTAAAQMEFSPFAKNGIIGQQQGAAPQSGIDLNKMNQLDIKHKMKLPLAPSDADMGNIKTEAAHYQQVDALQKDYQNAFDTLAKMPMHGLTAPKQRDAILKGLEAKAAPVTGVNHAAGFVSSQMPGPTDIGKETANTKRNSLNQYFSVLKAGHPTLQRYGLINSPQQQNQSQIKIVNGIKYTRGPNGEAIKVE